MTAAELTKLGSLCRRGHDDGEGRSTRYISSGSCIRCVALRNAARGGELPLLEPVVRTGDRGPRAETLARNERLIADKAAGATVPELAATYGISLELVRKIVQRHARGEKLVARARDPLQITDEQLREVLEAALAREVTRSGVARWVCAEAGARLIAGDGLKPKARLAVLLAATAAELGVRIELDRTIKPTADRGEPLDGSTLDAG